jgi:hypothetical protein
MILLAQAAAQPGCPLSARCVGTCWPCCRMYKHRLPPRCELHALMCMAAFLITSAHSHKPMRSARHQQKVDVLWLLQCGAMPSDAVLEPNSRTPTRMHTHAHARAHPKREAGALHCQGNARPRLPLPLGAVGCSVRAKPRFTKHPAHISWLARTWPAAGGPHRVVNRSAATSHHSHHMRLNAAVVQGSVHQGKLQCAGPVRRQA